MKTPVPLLALLVSATLSSATDGEVTSKIVEAHGQDGKVNARTETVYRGTNKVMVVTSRRNAKGKMVIEWRKFFTDEKPVIAENDRDGDGQLEVVQLYGPDGAISQTFVRETDGTVKPARKLNEHELELIQLARKQLDKGELDVAELNLQAVVTSAPHDGAAYYYLNLVEEAKQRVARTSSRWKLTP